MFEADNLWFLKLETMEISSKMDGSQALVATAAPKSLHAYPSRASQARAQLDKLRALPAGDRIHVIASGSLISARLMKLDDKGKATLEFARNDPAFRRVEGKGGSGKHALHDFEPGQLDFALTPAQVLAELERFVVSSDLSSIIFNYARGDALLGPERSLVPQDEGRRARRMGVQVEMWVRGDFAEDSVLRLEYEPGKSVKVLGLHDDTQTLDLVVDAADARAVGISDDPYPWTPTVTLSYSVGAGQWPALDFSACPIDGVVTNLVLVRKRHDK